MNKFWKTIIATCTLLLASLVPAAFAEYTWVPTLGLGDNSYFCATNNCLHSIGGVTVETKAGIDGTVYGLNSAHVLFTFTAATGWVEAATALQTAGGLPIVHISVGSSSEVMALTNAAYPTSNVYVLNSAGTAWVTKNGWLSIGEIGEDGTIWGLTSGGGICYNLGSAWVGVSVGYASVAVASANYVFAVSTSNGLFTWNGTAFTSVTVAFTPSSASNAISALGSTLSVLDTSGGIHYSEDGGITWHTIQGTASSITGGSAFSFTRNSAGDSFHVNLVVPTIVVTGGGNWTCPQGGCPPESFHTSTATASFGGIGGASGPDGSSASASGVPSDDLTPVAQEIGSNCDLFTDGDASECQPYYAGQAVCAVMGALNSLATTAGAPKVSNFLGQAHTLLSNTSGKAGYGCLTVGKVENCWFNTIPNCVNSPVVWAPPAVWDSPPGLAGWWSSAECIRAGSNFPWYCYAIPGAALKTTRTTPAVCTNP